MLALPRWLLCLIACSWLGAASGEQTIFSTRLEYNPPAVKTQCKVTFSFRVASVAIDAPQRLVLHLPHFTVPASTADTQIRLGGSGAESFETHAVWSPSTAHLQLFVRAQLVSTTLSVTLAPMLELPESGVLLNDATLKVAVSSHRNDDLAGLQWLSILQSPAVGSFYRPSSPTFVHFRKAANEARLQAGQAMTVILRFYARMRFLRGDTITLTLPGFTGPSRTVLMSDTEGDSSKFTAAWDAVKFQLTFTYADSTPHSANQETTLFTAEHVAADVHGITENSPAVRIEASAVEGPVLALPVQRTTGVAPLVLESEVSFSRSHCDLRGYRWLCAFMPPVAGLPAELNFRLQLSEPVHPGATITLHLKDYSSAGMHTSIPISSVALFPPGSEAGTEVERERHPYSCTSNEECESLSYTGSAPFRMAFWNETTKLLTMTSVDSVVEAANISITLPSAAGLRLPITGVPLMSVSQFMTRFAINNAGKQSPLSSFSQIASPVGAFHNISVEFGVGARATRRLPALKVSFAPTMALQSADSIHLNLEGFRGLDMTTSVLPAKSTAEWAVQWKSGTSELLLQPKEDVAPDSLVELQVYADSTGWGLESPAEGTQKVYMSEPLLHVTVTAKQGSVWYLPLVPSDRPAVIVGGSMAFANATIQRIPAIIADTELSFLRTEGSSSTGPIQGPTQAIFAFTPTVPLAAGDELTLYLPEFQLLGGTEIGLEDRSGVVLSGSWVQDSVPSLKLVVQRSLPQDSHLVLTIPASDTSGLLLPAQGLRGADASDASVAENEEACVMLSGIFAGVAMKTICVGKVDHVQPSILNSSLTFGDVHAAEECEAAFTMTINTAWQLVAGDEIQLRLPAFDRKPSSAPVDTVSSVPAGIVEGARWSGDMRLTFVIQETVSNHIIVKVPMGFGLVLPERGVPLRDAKSITFEIFRAGVGLVGATRITNVQLVAAIFNPLMRFLPIPAAGAPVNIRIWVTFSNELPSNTKIRWRLPGFLGQSVEQIFLNTPFSYPPGMIPEASWLADDGTGAGVLIATVGSETVPANQNLRIEIPITSGIRLPANGTAACTEGDECSITIFCDATTGLLRPTIFRGSDLIGFVTTASLQLFPKAVQQAVDMTFVFRFNFDIRAGDVLEVTLKSFSSEKPTALFVPEGKCRSVSSESKTLKCFKEMQMLRVSSRNELLLSSVVNTDVVRGEELTLIVPKSVGIRIPFLGLPISQSKQSPAGKDLIVFAVTRFSSMQPLEEAGAADRMVPIIPQRSLLDVPYVGSFKPMRMVISPNHPGAIVGLEIHLSPTMALQAGEHINMDLTGFVQRTPVLQGVDTVHTHPLPHSRPLSLVWLQVIEGPWDARGVTQGAIFQQQRQNATWDEATKRLSYEIRTSKDAGQGLTLVVGQSEGFRTPPNGIDLASSDLSKKLLISSDAVDGPVDPTVLDIAHMHPYLIHTTVGYNPPRAGTVAHLTFSVTTRTPFETGDIVRFTLANFTGGDWCWNSEEFMSSRCVLEKYSSTDQTRLLDDPTMCKFETCQEGCKLNDVPASQRGCRVSVLTAANPADEADAWRVGAAGCECLNVSNTELEQLWGAVKSSSSAPTGLPAALPAGYGTECKAWDSVGGISCSDLWPMASQNQFARRSPDSAKQTSQLGVWCCLPWCFVNASACPYSKPWAGGSSMHISYDTCLSARQASLGSCAYAPLPPEEDAIALASWVEATSQLMLTMKQPVDFGQKLAIEVPAQAGIMVPAGGLLDSDPFLTVDARNKMGKMKPINMERSPPVGIFLGRTSIAFGKEGGRAAAGMATEILFEFALSQALQVGEQVFFLLPSFDDSAPPGQLPRSLSVVSMTTDFVTQDMVSSCIWDPNSYQLTITFGKRVEACARVLVRITSGQIRLPAQGIRKSDSAQLGFRVWTNAKLAPVLYDPPTWVTNIETVGAFWYTYLSFDPPATATPTAIEIHFVTMMPLAFEDEIQVTLPGLTGPVSLTGIRVVPQQMLPATGIFRVQWLLGAEADAPGRILLTVMEPLPKNSACLIQLPASCIFTTPAGECDTTRHLTVVSVRDPASFTLQTASRYGPTAPLRFRLVRHVHSSPTGTSGSQASASLRGFVGKFSGDVVVNTGYLQDSNNADRAYCTTDAKTCPALADYRCYPLRLSATLEVGPSALLLRTQSAATVARDLGRSFCVSGSSTLATVSEIDGDTAKLVNKSDELGANQAAATLCMRLRLLNLVDLDGSFQRVLELQWGSTFRATGSGPQTLRLRIKLVSIKEFNPFDLDLSEAREQGWVRTALAQVCEVPVANVQFVAGKYPDISRCQQQKTCIIEASVVSDKSWQRIGVQAWQRGIATAVDDGSLESALSEQGVWAQAKLYEDVALSLLETANADCPRAHGQGPRASLSSSPTYDIIAWAQAGGEHSKAPQNAAIYGSWRHASALIGVPPLQAMRGSGVNAAPAAHCTHEQGAYDGDRVVYQDAYTLRFAYSAVLVQTSEVSDDPKLHGSSAATAKDSLVQVGVATRLPADKGRCCASMTIALFWLVCFIR